jgi:DNA-binding NarL/FixJ family response regulator
MSAKSLTIRLACDLKERQRRVLQLMSDGHTTIGISLKLRLSPKTVEFHRRALMERTGLNDTARLTKLAIRLGLTEIDV